MIASAAFLISACTDYNNWYTAEQLAYEASFQKDFGNFDPTNDFNLAQRGQVTVTPNGNREVCVYKKAPNGYQLIARYDDVTSTRTLGFDIPKGETEILVTNGSETQKTTIGGKVTFGAVTRAGKYDFNTGGFSAQLNDGERYTYYYYDAAEAQSFKTFLPENQPNKDKAIDDFTLVSTGEFIIYPTYWNASYQTMVGIYYYDEIGNIVKKPIFGNHKYNESIQFLNADGNWETDNLSSGYKNGLTDGKPADTQYRSKGIIVNLPLGTRFGFYTPINYSTYKNSYAPRNVSKAVTENGITYPKAGNWSWWGGVDAHSESHLNPPDIWTQAWTKETWMENTRHAVMFAMYYDSHGDMVIGAEDSYADGSYGWIGDYDLNDRMFKIYGSQPEVLNNKSQSWILPFEDLGGSFDWDYNDVILQMNYVNGQKTATITPVAAGGTLHSEVFFNDTDDDSKAQNLGEIHVLLGATPVEEDELYTPINASNRGATGTTKTVNITNPATFSIANAQSEANSSANGTSTKSIVGTYIVTKSNEGTSTIAYNGMGKAPAMLVLPTSYKLDDKYYEWAWPVEGKDIRKAYNQSGHSFTEWVEDHANAQDWFVYPTEGTVEEHSVSSTINTLVPQPEYNMENYGTIIGLPSKTNGVYAFPANLFDGASAVTVTVVLKGVKNNTLYAYNGSTYSTEEPLGTWNRIDGVGRLTLMGTNASGAGSGSVNYEGMYQVTLDADALNAIRTAGQWIVSAGTDTQILYIAYKLGN